MHDKPPRLQKLVGIRVNVNGETEQDLGFFTFIEESEGVEVNGRKCKAIVRKGTPHYGKRSSVAAVSVYYSPIANADAVRRVQRCNLREGVATIPVIRNDAGGRRALTFEKVSHRRLPRSFSCDAAAPMSQ